MSSEVATGGLPSQLQHMGMLDEKYGAALKPPCRKAPPSSFSVVLPHSGYWRHQSHFGEETE